MLKPVILLSPGGGGEGGKEFGRSHGFQGGNGGGSDVANRV